MYSCKSLISVILDIDVVVLGVKRILSVRTVVHVVVDAPQHQTFRQSTEGQVLVRLRAGSTRDGIDFAVDGTHLIPELLSSVSSARSDSGWLSSRWFEVDAVEFETIHSVVALILPVHQDDDELM